MELNPHVLGPTHFGGDLAEGLLLRHPLPDELLHIVAQALLELGDDPFFKRGVRPESLSPLPDGLFQVEHGFPPYAFSRAIRPPSRGSGGRRER